MLVLGGFLFLALLWGGVYLQVVEASRGMPGLRAAVEPAMKPEQAAELQALQRSLSGLGFRHDGWFSLDDFDETHVSAWKHGDRARVRPVLSGERWASGSASSGSSTPRPSWSARRG